MPLPGFSRALSFRHLELPAGDFYRVGFASVWSNDFQSDLCAGLATNEIDAFHQALAGRRAPVDSLDDNSCGESSLKRWRVGQYTGDMETMDGVVQFKCGANADDFRTDLNDIIPQPLAPKCCLANVLDAK